MSSMSKVMQKLREAAADANESEQPNEAAQEAADVLAGAMEAAAEFEPADTDGEVADVDASAPADAVAESVPAEPAEPQADAALESAETPSSFVPGDAATPTGFEAADDADDVYNEAGFTEPDVAETMGGAFDDSTVEWNAARVDPVVIPFHNRYSAICEQYRSVRARLLTMNAARAQQVLVVSSSIPEEGKSVTTVNLSLVMAEGGEHRILLVDGDFRRGAVARMLGIPSQPGFADVLRGDISLEEALQPTPFPNLKILPAGQVVNGAYSDLLGGPATANVLEEFRAAFDYALVDTPPITTVSDVCLLAPHCDGALVVIEMRRTPEPTVQQAVRTLQSNNVKILGCVLSRFRERGAGYYEHYYSSYYNR
jgi:capsular exopolysaccharide synthesis family protein